MKTEPREISPLPAVIGAALVSLFAFADAQAQTIKWGLTLVNINNPTTTTVVTNGDGSVSITTAGGDTYSSPDSLAYAYQQLTGDFDVKVRVKNVVADDPATQDSPKGSLMVRSSLDPGAYDFQISALPLAPSGRDGQIESIGRMNLSTDTDDLPGRGQVYGGDTTMTGYCTYPDVWLRIQRQGDKFMSYFATTNITDYPSQTSPLSTNGWQLLVVTRAGTNFPKTVYVGLSTVAHNSSPSGTLKVTSTYDAYGPTPTTPSIPANSGVAVAASNAPGPFPITKVLGINWDASVSADGMGYPPDIVQSNQGPAQPIVWNSAGFGGVARDIIASVNSETPDGFSVARYQAGAFDFLLSPRDTNTAYQNLGPYSNPMRERYSTGDVSVAASQSWVPSPNYGFVMTTVRKNGQAWNDSSPFFYAATYVQLDDVATGKGYDMIGGQFRGGQFYTRSTKLVTGSVSSGGPTSGALQRCAIPISLAWFPYAQGWKAGYIDDSSVDTSAMGIAHWKRGDGFGLNSGSALAGLPTGTNQSTYNLPTSNLVSWLQTPDGSGIYSGLALLKLNGVNTTNGGMLFTVGNDENNGIRGPSANNAALTDGSGWYVAVRDIDASKADPTIYATHGASDAGSSFSFLYVPFNADNLIGGHIATNGSTLKGAGNFSITHLAAGRYALSIPGKTGTSGALFVQNTGYLPGSNVVDVCLMSYEYGGTNSPANSFIIQSRFIDASGGGEGVATLRDAEFNFLWVDFQNPVAPPGTVPPVLSIQRTNNNRVVVSWVNGPGFVLTSSTSLASNAVWTSLGTQNPQTITVTPGPLYFRVVSP